MPPPRSRVKPGALKMCGQSSRTTTQLLLRLLPTLQQRVFFGGVRTTTGRALDSFAEKNLLGPSQGEERGGERAQWDCGSRSSRADLLCRLRRPRRRRRRPHRRLRATPDGVGRKEESRHLLRHVRRFRHWPFAHLSGRRRSSVREELPAAAEVESMAAAVPSGRLWRPPRRRRRGSGLGAGSERSGRVSVHRRAGARAGRRLQTAT